MSNAVDDAVSMEVPGWEASSNGYVLTMEAEVVTRRLQDTRPPQLILRFCLQTISASTHAIEHAYFTIEQPYQSILHEAAWDVETWWMLSHVATDHVRTADFALLVLAFRRYTRSVLDRFPIMELSMMEFFSLIEIPPTAPSISTGPLHYFVPPETQQDFFEDNVDVVEPIRGPTPALAAVVEGLQMKIVEEPGICSICLDDFNITTHVLEMPCHHIFHDKCLREWLTRSNTCPLCRFTLPDDTE